MRRLGRIILIILACLGGIFLLTILSLGMGLSHIANQHAKANRLPEKMVLSLDLEVGVDEAPAANGLDILGGSSHGYELRKLVSGIEAAASDPKVKGMLLRLGNSGISLSQAQEIRAALLKFQKSGKPSLAFAESFGEGGSGIVDLYLASATDKIWLQPSGLMAINGFMLESPFLKGLFDKLGVKASFERRHEYKSAPEMFTGEKFSPEARESLEKLLQSWLRQAGEGIAAGRKLNPEILPQLVNDSPYLPEEALNLGLIDKLAYRDEAEAEALGEDEDNEFVDVEDYQASRPKKGETPHKFALIRINGTIVSGLNEDWGQGGMVGADSIVDAIKEAAEDEEIKAIVLRIDSPGGSYSAADAIHRAVEAARDEKPVIASLGETAASGGYFAAMAAHKVIANPGTIAGSIGVFSGKMVLNGLWEKLGIGWDEVHIGNNAGMWSANRDFTPQGKAKLERILDQVYGDFTQKAAKARNFSPEAIDKAARGRVFAGKEALDIGLIDQLGGLKEALNAAKQQANIPETERVGLVILPQPQNPWQMFLAMLKDGGGALSLLAGLNSRAVPLLQQLPSSKLKGPTLLWQPGL